MALTSAVVIQNQSTCQLKDYPVAKIPEKAQIFF